MKKKLLFFVTEDWYFCSHRLPLAVYAKENGFDVSVLTRVNSHEMQIKDAGLRLIPFDMSRRSINPFVEFKTICRLILIYRFEQPDIVHHVALKPVIYGTIASFFSKIPNVVNALAGLGFLFSSSSLIARLLRPFMKQIFRLLLNRQNSRLILQNPDDVYFMNYNRILHPKYISLIRGSGVDIKEFLVSSAPSGKVLVVLASRLLWDKGVGEFVAAAKKLLTQGVIARFALVGSGDDSNPSSISHEQLICWDKQGMVEWWGRHENMPAVMAQAHIVCLPSYYGEGVPKVLIEAASCGRPIVTTDTPGCREIVHDGVNGFLVPVRNATAVADAIKKMIESPTLRQRMGAAGRTMVERDFTIDIVNAETLKVYRGLLC